MRQEFADYFKEDIRLLATIFGRDLEYWLNVDYEIPDGKKM